MRNDNNIIVMRHKEEMNKCKEDMNRLTSEWKSEETVRKSLETALN